MSSQMDKLALHLLNGTQEAALACYPWVGRGDSDGADGAAVAAMRAAFDALPAKATVVIGEGEKDEAPMLYLGEVVGSGDGPEIELAVDPLENTSACARGIEGAVAVVAATPAGTMWETPGWYMNKVVVGPAAAGVIDIERPPEDNVRRVAEALDKPLEETMVVVLDKPRHEDLVKRLHELGASVRLIPEGDILGALEAVFPDGPADLLLGIGGTPEGVITACAVRILGGDMQAALAPQKEGEEERLAEAGQKPGQPITLEELIGSDDCCFVATGVTTGALLQGPERTAWGWRTNSLVVTRLHPGLLIDSPYTTASTEEGADA
ncbi:MAG: class II fructose-bisphosphatase [Actinomycetota bacterium]|nr:class II fructose-bisphosphatase [Actinomycetota bacterium]